MKIRNKTTGEIETLTLDSDGETLIIMKDDEMIVYGVSLEGLVQNWEDVPEEPKEYWCIDCFSPDGLISKITGSSLDILENRKSIDNYFDTREEAEKAVEKLKALKRLKDKGFRFVLAPGVGALDVVPGKFQIDINADMPEKWFCCDAVQKDLDLLFGGKE